MLQPMEFQLQPNITEALLFRLNLFDFHNRPGYYAACRLLTSLTFPTGVIT